MSTELTTKQETGITKEGINRYFSYFTKKPNSIMKSFPKKIFVGKDDIIRLITNIADNLQTYHVENANLILFFQLKDNKMIEFGKLEDFKSYPFEEDTPIESISMAWDFLYSNYENEKPDKYQLNIRITNSFSPIHFLRKLVSDDQNEFNTLDIELEPCIVKIDFVNPKISDSLLNEVSKWNKGCRDVVVITPFIKKMNKNPGFILQCIQYVFPLFTFIIAVSSWHLIQSKGWMDNFGYWIMGCLGAFFVAYKIGQKMASRFAKRMSTIGITPIFDITLGDKNYNSEIEKKCVKAKESFIKISIINILYGIIASLISSGLIGLFKK